jgi:hypothetical protein
MNADRFPSECSVRAFLKACLKIGFRIVSPGIHSGVQGVRIDKNRFNGFTYVLSKPLKRFGVEALIPAINCGANEKECASIFKTRSQKFCRVAGFSRLDLVATGFSRWNTAIAGTLAGFSRTSRPWL